MALLFWTSEILITTLNQITYIESFNIVLIAEILSAIWKNILFK